MWSSDTLQEIVHLKALNKVTSNEKIIKNLLFVTFQTCTCLAVCPAAIETIIGNTKQQQGGVAEDKGVAGQCAVGYNDGILRVFELAERKMIVKWQPHKRAVNNISYSING